MGAKKSSTRIDYEGMLARELDDAGIRYEREFRFHPVRQWRSDFYLPDYALLVEIDGILYRTAGRHQTGSGYQNDLLKMNEATCMGYTCLRFTPAMVKGTAKNTTKGSPLMERAIDTITRFIEVKRLAKRNGLPH